MESFPPVSKALVDRLAEYYPDRCPKETDSLDRIRMNAGAAEVVRFLRNKMLEQSETILEETS